MPIRPTPVHYHCRLCGWSKTVAPCSDALGPGDFYRSCPQCKHSPLESGLAYRAGDDLIQAANTIVRLWKTRR